MMWKWYWRVEIGAWIACAIATFLAAIEGIWGVISGTILLVGTLPALLIAYALIFGGAAILVREFRGRVDRIAERQVAPRVEVRPAPAQAKAQTGRPVYTNETQRAQPKKDGFTVRMQPQAPAQRQRSRASREILEASI